MQILSVEFRNFASYGNALQKLEFEEKRSHLYLVLGGNGFGKCLSPETKIEIKIENKELEKKFKDFITNKYKL